MQRKDFISYVNSLPNVKVETIQRIAEATCSSVNTVYRWLSGEVRVPLLKRKVISNLLQIPEEVLWPNEKE